MSATATKVKFLSKYRNLRLLRIGAVDHILPNGHIKTVEPELVYEFENGELSVEAGRDLVKDGPWDPQAREAAEQDSLSWLRNHPEYNSLFHEVPVIAPDPSDIYVAVARAAARGDLDTIHGLLVQEKASWDRPEVIEVIADAGQTLETALLGPESPPEATEE